MSRRFLQLRGWAILAVVCNHAAWWGFGAYFWWARPTLSPDADMLRTASYYGLLSVHQLSQFSVAAFIFISGCFAAYAARGDPPSLTWKVARRQSLGLLRPYLIWSMFAIAVQVVLHRVRPSLAQVYSPSEYLVRLLDEGVEGGYWFIPTLVYLYALSPLLVWITRINKLIPILIGFLGVLYALISRYLGFEPMWLGHPFGELLDVLFSLAYYLFFYSFGLLLGTGSRRRRFGVGLARYRWPLLALVAVLGLSTIFEADLAFYTCESLDFATSGVKLSSVLYQLMFILAYLSCGGNRGRTLRIVEGIGRASYGILLLHWRVLWLVSKGLYNMVPLIVDYQVVFQLLLIVSAVGLPYLVVRLVRRARCRKLRVYLFG